MKNFQIAVLPGDGIGPEIIGCAVEALEAVGARHGIEFDFAYADIGGIAIDTHKTPLPKETVAICKGADAVLLGAVGGPKWDGLSGDKRPEAGLLGIRAELGLFANLRPATIFKALAEATPLKSEIIGDGLDLMVVRELTGGIYFGERGRGEDGGRAFAYDTERYFEYEIERIATVAFELARQRSGNLCSVDKANVLESSRFWRETVTRIHAEEYEDVELSHMYVDNAAMQLVRDPKQFDVILTSNLFGDILSDEASMLTGSIGMLPSASLGEQSFGLYEPIHGSAPDIAGKGIANPIACILSAAMMLRYTLDCPSAAQTLESAVEAVLDGGARTADIAAGGTYIGTREMQERIVKLVNS